MPKYKIAWMPGDGCGCDVMDAARQVLDAMDFDAEYIPADIGWEFWCHEGDPLPPNLYFDTSNYEALGGLESAVEQFGSGKILFGSNFPLFNPLANVDKVGRANIEETDREAIAFGNAAQLLGM